jgi:tungstate transport system ATP-binding protein
MPDTVPSTLPVVAEGLVYEAAGRRLLDGVDLRLGQGTRTVIMGHNGAGKSLLLRLLHGLLEPAGGRVTWNGAPPSATRRRRQALVFQRPVLLRRSVAANVRFAMAAGEVPDGEREARLGDALDAAGLTPLARQPARLLSGGEQQRLALARALALRPEVLFLDEPTANLDPTSTAAVERLVDRAHDAGAKVVLVTHDAGQARRLADEVVFLHAGRVDVTGPADHFFDAPKSARAEAFLDGRLVT